MSAFRGLVNNEQFEPKEHILFMHKRKLANQFSYYSESSNVCIVIKGAISMGRLRNISPAHRKAWTAPHWEDTIREG